MFKYIGYHYEKNFAMNMMVLLQLVLAQLIIIATVSMGTYYIRDYISFRDYLNSEGLYMEVDTFSEKHVPFQYTEEIESKLTKCHVIANHMATLHLSDGFATYDPFFLSYDKEAIDHYKPELKSGKWLSEYSFDKNNPVYHVVVSSNVMSLAPGTILTAYSLTDEEFKLEIVGTLKKDATIWGHTMGGRFIYDDYRKMFHELGVLDEYTFTIIMNQDEIKAGNELLPEGKGIQSIIDGDVLIRFDNDITDDEVDANKKILREYGEYSGMEDISKIREETKKVLLDKVKLYIPLVILLLTMTFISTISGSIIFLKRMLSRYAIFSMCGMSVKKMILLNVMNSFVVAVFSSLIAFILALIEEKNKLVGTAMEVTGYEVTAVVIIGLFYCLIAAIVPIIMLNREPPRELLLQNKE